GVLHSRCQRRVMAVPVAAKLRSNRRWDVMRGRPKGRQPIVNIVSDPPVVMNMSLARQHIDALDQLPRPTLVTCRTGPRSSAVIYLYAGLRAGATAEEVLARAEADGAPFAGSDELRAWVTQGLDELS